MKYFKLFSVFPVMSLASISFESARPTFDSGLEELEADFQPGAGYLDESINSDFTYVDGDEEVIKADGAEAINIRAKRQSVDYGTMSAAPHMTGADFFGTTTFGGTTGGATTDYAEMVQKAQQINQQSVNNNAPVINKSAEQFGTVEAPQPLSVNDGVSAIKQLQHALESTFTDMKNDHNTEQSEVVKEKQLNHVETALKLLKEEYGGKLSDDEIKRKVRTQMPAHTLVESLATFTQGAQANLFRTNGKKCRKGQQMNSNGHCEAVLPLNLNYGCWCHADNTDIFKGKGQHVDEFDKACKMYKQCLRCVKHDARNAGEVCDPGTVSYSTEGHRSKDGIHMECSKANTDNCSINTCCCEVEYVRTILRLFVFEGVKLNNKMYHNKFDHEEKCEGKAGNGHTNECCGYYPHRRMYNTQGKQCCHNNSVFDPYTHVCCDDGSTANSVNECGSPVRKRKRRSVVPKLF